MSVTSCVIKAAIKWTPKVFVLWGGNFVLRGVAKLTDFRFDLESRKAYVQVKLYGEPEFIEVWMEGFAMMEQAGGYSLLIRAARSNRIWLNNLLAKLVGKPWKIPEIPQLRAQMALASELLRVDGATK